MPFFGGGVRVRFVFACVHVLYNRVYIWDVVMWMCKGDYVRCVMMVSKILLVGVTV